MDSESIQKLLLERIRPYEDRIEKLDSSLKEKDIEIVTLQHAVLHLKKEMETLKTKHVKHIPSTLKATPSSSKLRK